MTCLVSRRSLCLDACGSRFILLFEGEDEGEGLGCKGTGLLPYFLSHLALFFVGAVSPCVCRPLWVPPALAQETLVNGCMIS